MSGARHHLRLVILNCKGSLKYTFQCCIFTYMNSCILATRIIVTVTPNICLRGPAGFIGGFLLNPFQKHAAGRSSAMKSILLSHQSSRLATDMRTRLIFRSILFVCLRPNTWRDCKTQSTWVFFIHELRQIEIVFSLKTPPTRQRLPADYGLFTVSLLLLTLSLSFFSFCIPSCAEGKIVIKWTASAKPNCLLSVSLESLLAVWSRCSLIKPNWQQNGQWNYWTLWSN